MSIIQLLKELASVKPAPNNTEVDKLLNQHSNEIKQAILQHDNQTLKNLISNNRSYANETKVTVY